MTTLAYVRGLFGGFLFDDFPNLVDKPELRALDGSTFRWLALAMSSNAGPLRRPISMLSFGLDYSFFGLNPIAFKLTNLIIHFINGLLLYKIFSRLATKLIQPDTPGEVTAKAIAFFAAAAWILHPLNVSTVLYIVQRMDELSTLFVLLGLIAYIHGRERMLCGKSGMARSFLGLSVFGGLAVLSKENGALIMPYALVIEYFCYHFATTQPYQRQVIKSFFVATVALPIVLVIGYIYLHPQWLGNGYAGRDFSLVERLLSETRILCSYLLWIFLPYPGWMGVYHDDISISSGLVTPLTTLPSLIIMGGLVISAWCFRKKSPAAAFGISWFLIGQSMESTIFPLELAFDHRNYLPMAGLILGVACTVTPWLMKRLRARAAVGVAISVLLLLAGITSSWAYEWGSPLRLAKYSVEKHPDSARALYELGRQIIFAGTAVGRRTQSEDQAVPYFERATRVSTTDIYAASSLLLIKARGGAEVPQASITDLAWRVRHMRQPAINPFLVVMTAAIRGELKISSRQMQQLVDSALGNPALNKSMRAMVLNNYGHYMFQIVHDDQAAVSLTLSAAAQDPTNPLFEINLTRLAIALGNLPQAETHLARATQLNRAGLYDSSIKELQSSLAELARPSASPTSGSVDRGSN